VIWTAGSSWPGSRLSVPRWSGFAAYDGSGRSEPIGLHCCGEPSCRHYSGSRQRRAVRRGIGRADLRVGAYPEPVMVDDAMSEGGDPFWPDLCPAPPAVEDTPALQPLGMPPPAPPST
jgi:hypothetical protein